MVKHRLSTLAAVVVGAGVGVSNGLRLAAYSVPGPFAAACATAMFCVVTSFVLQLADTLRTTTHRCRVPGCDFRVRLRDASAVDNRRWQEIAAQHPNH